MVNTASAADTPDIGANPADPRFRRAVGDGLVLRWSTTADAERLGDVVAEVFGSGERPASAERKAVFESFRPGYPHGGPGDWALVEHVPTGRIVSATVLMHQTWTYDGIMFTVGRPEQVVTRKAFRDRGLVRAIFDLLHARSTARGQLAQVIDGIPAYYRQFGYEYTLESFGGVRVYWSAIDAGAMPERDEPYRLRRATLDDVPQVHRLHVREQSDSLVSVRLDEAYWRWVLRGYTGASAADNAGQDHTGDHGWRPLMIVDAPSGASVGCVVLREGYHWSDPSALPVISLGTEPGVPLRRVLPAVLRALKRMVPGLPVTMTGTPALRLLFLVGRQHPVHGALHSDIASPARDPYAWYVRVPDLPAFVRHIAPALERRLAASPLAGQSFSLGVGLYRGLLTLTFEGGRFVSVVEDSAHRGALPGDAGCGAALPRGQMLQLLFGYRSLDELCATFPDVTVGDEAGQALDILFPKRFSRPLLVN